MTCKVFPKYMEKQAGEKEHELEENYVLNTDIKTSYCQTILEWHFKNLLIQKMTIFLCPAWGILDMFL